MSRKALLSVVAMAVVAFGTAGLWGATGVLSGSSGPGDPRWTLSDQEAPVVAAYLYAGSHRGEAARIPCYCGCRDLGHGNLMDCFITGRG